MRPQEHGGSGLPFPKNKVVAFIGSELRTRSVPTWLAVAGEQRHEVLLNAMDEFRGLLREVVNAE
jgi:hypothetical protein